MDGQKDDNDEIDRWMERQKDDADDETYMMIK